MRRPLVALDVRFGLEFGLELAGDRRLDMGRRIGAVFAARIRDRAGGMPGGMSARGTTAVPATARTRVARSGRRALRRRIRAEGTDFVDEAVGDAVGDVLCDWFGKSAENVVREFERVAAMLR